MQKLKLPRIFLPLVVALFFVAWVLYYFFACRYQLLFMEQQELFLFTGNYFHDYLSRPGGLAAYAGAFLLQFFYHPLAGAFIMALLGLSLFALLFCLVKRMFPRDLAYFVALLPAILLFILQHDHSLSLAMALSLVLSLLGLWAGFSIRNASLIIPFRGLILLFLLFAGGVSVWIPLLLFLFDALLSGGRFRFVGPLVWIFVLSALVLILQNTLYRTYSFDDLLLANISFRLGLPFYGLLLSLLWFWCLATATVSLFVHSRSVRIPEGRYLWARSVLFAHVVGLLAWGGVRQAENKNAEQILHIDHAVMMQDWSEALEVCRAYPEPNNVVWQYANLSLFMQGRLLDDFLEFSSTDFDPLFLPFSANNLIPLFGQEVYYQMGLMNESVRWAFEASVANPQGTQSRLLRRLAQGNLILGKYEVAGKYLSVLEHSLYYKRWASQMKQSLSDTLSNQFMWVKTKRNLLPSHDFFSGGHPILFLEHYLDQQPHNKMAFEYLMAYYLLSKDLKAVMDYLPQLFNHDYAKFPSLLAQVVVLYLATHPQDADVLKSYPIPSDVFKQFELFHSVLRANQANPEVAKALLKKDFGKTVWYYLQFDNSLEQKMQINDEQVIY